MPVVIEPPELGQGGILGIEGRHCWNDGVVMNDLTADPHVIIDAIGGLRSLADGEDNRDTPPGRRGEKARKSLRRGKTLAYEGRVRARSMADLRVLMEQLAADFDDLAEGRMLVAPHPEYTEGFARFFRGRALTFNDGEIELDPFNAWPYQQAFAIGIRMSDARFYETQQVVKQTGAISTSTGLAPPFTPPITIPATGTGAGTVVVDNPGTAPVDPVIDIYGPVTNPLLTNVTEGLAIGFTGVLIPEGSFLRIDFAARQVLLAGTSDYRSRIDWAESDWWDPGADGLLAGENTLQLRGDTIADPAHALITFYPAYTA